MFGNRGSRIASGLISFMPTSRWHALKRFLLRYLGGIEIGDRTTIFSGARFTGRYIKIGHDCHIGERCEIIGCWPHASVSIGDWCSFGPDVFMSTAGHDLLALGDNHRQNGISMPITIGNHVGLGVRSMIMPGVILGDYAQISAGVVVSKNVKPYTLVAHAPLRSIELPLDFKTNGENNDKRSIPCRDAGNSAN